MDIEARIREVIEAALAVCETPFDALNMVQRILHEYSPNKQEPVSRVIWVPIERVTPNSYNPNHVAKSELTLLLKSIWSDGFTQPVVTIENTERGVYEIVDGFHRYFTAKVSPDLYERCHGHLPIVVIEKDIKDRMAATVRHNRARGKHSIDGMANLVFQMLDEGCSDAEVCNELGMEAEELVRLKHITGFSKLFADTAYNRAWVTRNQIRIKLAQDGTGFSRTGRFTEESSVQPDASPAVSGDVAPGPAGGGGPDSRV